MIDIVEVLKFGLGLFAVVWGTVSITCLLLALISGLVDGDDKGCPP